MYLICPRDITRQIENERKISDDEIRGAGNTIPVSADLQNRIRWLEERLKRGRREKWAEATFAEHGSKERSLSRVLSNSSRTRSFAKQNSICRWV
jgi:hypothetical protein